MRASDVMTHCIVSIGPDAPVRDAIARMISHEVSGLPVIDERGQLAGIVTEADLLRRVEIHTAPPRRRWVELLMDVGSRAEDYLRTHGRLVRDVMTVDVVTVSSDTTLAEVARLMEERGIKRIPVVDEGRVIGIVSRADLMCALGELLTRTKRHKAPDDVIRAAIHARMRIQTWCPLHQVKIVVRNGSVELKGTIFDERQRRAMTTLVDSVPGVKAVHDHLTLAERADATLGATAIHGTGIAS